MMRVRLRAPGGQHTAELATDCTLGDLKAVVAEKTGIPPESQELLAGFPPKLLAPAEGDAATCASCGVSNGESITVRELPGVVAAAAAAAAEAEATPSPLNAAPADAAFNPADVVDEDEELGRAIAASLADADVGGGGPPAAKAARTDDYVHVPPGGSSAGGGSGGGSGGGGGSYEEDGTAAARRVIDSDNSCLFNAVGYVMSRSLREAPALRRVIADAVSGDQFTYNEGFLGKDNAEYCKWILESQHWGGAVELSILAKHFGREIAAYDIQTQRCDVYGSGEGYAERTMLLYDGLHYDAMVLAYEGAPHDMDITIHSAEGAAAEAAERKARVVVAQAHGARQFTDTANFSLRCLVCQQGLKVGGLSITRRRFESDIKSFVNFVYDLFVCEESKKGSVFGGHDGQPGCGGAVQVAFLTSVHFVIRAAHYVQGEKEAVEHAKATGHKNFGEY
jgi:ubiquitin thioesterase OTU1